MSRYYPNSRGGGRGGRGGGYYQNSYRSGGYDSGRTGGSQYYDNRAQSGGGRYYPNRDRRDSGGASSRNQLEIAKKLVDTIMSTAGGGRRSGDYGEPPYKRQRDDGYDRDRSLSQRRYSDYRSGSGGRDYRRLSDSYPDRRVDRPRSDGFRAPQRPYSRGRGYSTRGTRGYAGSTRGAARRSYDGAPRSRPMYRSDREEPTGRLSVTKCPHCHVRCATFADFRKHQLGREHMAAMRKVLMKVRAELAKMRSAQREMQKELEEKEKEKDPEAFEKLENQFCSLCRLSYKECEGVVHTETEWHKKQKTYANPYCATCKMNFPARIAYEKHIGTFSHIQRTTAKEKGFAGALSGFMTVDSVGDVDGDEGGATGAGGRARRPSADHAEEPGFSATAKLQEMGDYDGKQAVGNGYMRKTEVYHCGLCDIYIKITAKVNAVLVKHCMSKKHFDNYKTKLTKLAEEEEKERAAKAKAEAEAAEKEAAEQAAAEAAEVQPGEFDGEEMPAEEDAAPGGAASTDGNNWEQMDDNFILGDDQEDETAKKEDEEEAAE